MSLKLEFVLSEILEYLICEEEARYGMGILGVDVRRHISCSHGRLFEERKWVQHEAIPRAPAAVCALSFEAYGLLEHDQCHPMHVWEV